MPISLGLQLLEFYIKGLGGIFNIIPNKKDFK